MRTGHRQRIEAIAGERLARVEYLPGGCVGEVWKASFDGGLQIVVKTAMADDTLDIEAYMLQYLVDHSKLPVPKVLSSAPDLLVIDMIANDQSSGGCVDEDAADHLAILHTITAPKYGLDKDTLIGPLRQPNSWTENWVDFFATHRLRHLGEITFKQGKLPQDVYARLCKLCDKLDSWICEPDAPSLLHGDVWGGNVLSKDGRIAAFIDPAIYYGHREVELAYTTLFQTFGARFFDRYQEHHKLDRDFFSVRMPIYHLYPLLVHVALFGGTYVAETDTILKRFVD